MKYTILEGASITDLMGKVAKAIENGWDPQGGVCVDTPSALRGETNFYQAMVKYV